jgi:5-methylcytosine-specific restriction endonuclease McrA
MASRHSTARTILSIVRTDRTFELLPSIDGAVWQGKCIHCQSKLLIKESGEPISRATIEHIVPRHHGGTDDPGNLALACARCNHQKGKKLDARRLTDPTLQRVIALLQARRLERLREDPDEG